MTEHRIDLSALAKDRGTHSSFGPSSSHMWLYCPGSLIPNLLAPDDAGVDAAYGTVAHGVAEQWGKSGKKPTHLLGTNEFVESGNWGHLIEIDEVMFDHARACIDWVDFLPGEKWFERRVYFSQLTPIPNQGGTADFISCTPGRMVIADWKFGKGYVVYAENNTQAQLYALGAFYELDHIYHFDEIEIRIAQPRLDHFDTWVISRQELLAFAEWVKPRAAAAWDVNAPRVPGIKQCQFCKVRFNCAARAKVMVDITEGCFDSLDSEITPDDISAFGDELDLIAVPNIPDPMSLTIEQMAQLLPWQRAVESFWTNLRAELSKRAARGETIPGYKLVEGRSRRMFRYPRDAGEHLVSLGVPRKDVFIEKTPSPKEAEELLLKNGRKRAELPELLDGYVYKPPGKPSLVPVHDKRPALVDVSESAFADLADDVETSETEDY